MNRKTIFAEHGNTARARQAGDRAGFKRGLWRGYLIGAIWMTVFFVVMDQCFNFFGR
jgi:hypothetical protein